MSLQQDMIDAIGDVATQVRNGTLVADAIAEIAPEYDIKVAALTARFERAFPNGVPAAAPTLANLIEDKVAAACLRYGVPVSATLVTLLKSGTKITAICRDGREIIGVRHSDGSTMRYQQTAFSEASVKFGEALAA